jgi:hypothetical protein
MQTRVSFGAKPGDFVEGLPIAVLIRSPLDGTALDRSWAIKFLTVLVGSIRGLDQIADAADIMRRLVESGVHIIVQERCPVDMFASHQSIEAAVTAAVEKAAPELSTRTLRLRPGVTPDFSHDNSLTTVIWVFSNE